MPRPNVHLISMPWTALGEPSLGLGVLRAELEAQGIACRVRHLNLFLLQHIRASTYLALANTFALNDFVFSGVLDPGVSNRQMRHLRSRVEEMLTLGLIESARFGGCDGVIDQILRLRDEVIPVWLEREAAVIAKDGATLVGFTCMFDQTVASLALAKLVKQKSPQTVIAFGGYALRPPTGQEIMRCFPWVDAICVGEGEGVIGPLARASVGELPLTNVPGVLVRTVHGTRLTLPPPPLAMDASPVPNFDDYFSDIAELRDEHHVEISNDTLPFETARGCWWGQIKHCVFCGIADEDLTYRARSPENVLHALSTLHDRYDISSFRFSDYILPHQYHKTLIPMLIDQGAPYRLACEMKANTSPERMSGLATAGFAEIQPGIESFSSQVLRQMDKGVSAIRNVQTLLLGLRNGIRIHYNVLYGLPDDQPDAYEAMVAALPHLVHLNPPLTRTRIQITRYAPLQAAPERFGVPPARYEPSYEVIFSPAYLEKSSFDLNAYCYYFQHSFENGPQLQALYRRLTMLVDAWKRLHRERDVALWYEMHDSGMTIFDSRRHADGEVRHVGLEMARIYGECVDDITTVEAIAETLGLPLGTVTAAIAEFLQQGLVFRDGRSLIGLALPREIYEPAAKLPQERRWAVA